LQALCQPAKSASNQKYHQEIPLIGVASHQFNAKTGQVQCIQRQTRALKIGECLFNSNNCACAALNGFGYVLACQRASVSQGRFKRILGGNDALCNFLY
jgi:hypothetical protein